MRHTILTCCLLGCMASLFAQTANQLSASEQQDDPVLMTIDGQPVYLSEYMYIYEKNNQETSADSKSMDEYLELFTNFKLKVAEATAEHLDTTAAFAEELRGYRGQVVDKYLRDEQAIDSLVRLSYQRMSHLRRAAHIAIRCPQDASDSVRQAAEARINDLRKQALAGANFYELANTYSEDPNKAQTGSELGWIIPFRYIYSFEDAVYNTPVGQITPVFRSPFGLHIAVVEEEVVTEEVQAAHIMKMVPKGDVEKGAEAKRMIDSLYQVVMNGADFNETALRYSDDKGSAVKGGDLGWFSRGVMVLPFEQTAFSLQPGETSQPFRSDYGWHIIRLYDRRFTQPLDTLYSKILRNVERDERMEQARLSFIRKTRAEYQLPDTMSNEQVIAYADAHLEEKYPDFRHLVQEYHDGILLFDISVDRVWDKAGKDTAGLQQYFASHKDQYTWDEPRFKGFVIYARDKQTARRVETIIKTVPADSVYSVVRQRVNTDSTIIARVDKGLWKPGANPAIDKFGFKNKKATFETDDEYPVIKVIGKKLKAPETYMDDRNRVVTDYQDLLEKEWVEELKQKHTVVLNQDVWLRLKSRL